MAIPWLKESREINGELIEIRRQLHQYPELGYEEEKTGELIEKVLKDLGLEVQRGLAKTGVVALLKGDKPGKTIGIRGDMDALALQEENDKPYRSKTKRKMHACGHDAHMTYVIGAAKILKKYQSQLTGNVKFIFQPAEETTGGAKPMIEQGVLENPKVDGMIGGHVWPDVPAGKIEIVKGPVMASTGQLHLEIHGKGGHAARPHENVDPIMIGQEIIQRLYSLTSRQIDPLENLVISICSFQAGETYNVMPEKAVLKGTIRTLNNKLRLALPEKIEKVVKSVTDYYGATYYLNIEHLYPATVNDKDFSEFAERSAKEFYGEENVLWGDKPSMAGEDFAFYLEKVPGTFLRIGNYDERQGLTYNLHNPNFDIDEHQLGKVSALYAKIAMDFLAEEIE